VRHYQTNCKQETRCKNDPLVNLVTYKMIIPTSCYHKDTYVKMTEHVFCLRISALLKQIMSVSKKN